MNNQNTEEAPMPSDKLPECWWDNDRMNALFAPFRNKNVNSEDWNSKLHFWTKFITEWGIHNNICTFSIVELKKSLKRDGRAPGCIPTVVEEMYKSGELQTMDRFMQTPQETWSGWAIDLLVKKPIYWSYTKMKESVVSLTDDNSKFVNVKTVKAVSEKILASVNEDCYNNLINLNHLTKLVSHLNITEDNLKLCLHYLRCVGKVSLKENSKNMSNKTEEEDAILIKFVPVNEKASPVNEIDLSIYALEKNEQKLIKMIEELESKKEAVMVDAKAYVAKGMRPLAKNCLRKKLTLEKCIEKRSNVLDNVQVLLSHVKETEYESKVVDSYKKGVNAFKSTFKEAGLTEDNVNEVISDVQEVLEMHDEIQSSLGQNLSQTIDSELEEELAELLAESPKITPMKIQQEDIDDDLDKKHEDIEKRLRALHVNLPSPPKNTPSPQRYVYN